MKNQKYIFLFLFICFNSQSSWGSWMSEVRDLTAQVEASRKKNYEKFEKAIAISNYERSNFMWFSKSFELLKL
ncbi:MAG: hypothetical protein H6625_04395 [Bdellovibrionaceae bacterium]|nr:hypothetical protein [Pseudobdellovibrionaceae bacterium]